MSDTHTKRERPPVWKQIAGAIGGAALALAVYSVYESAVPYVSAYLLPPGTTEETEFSGETRFADKDAGVAQSEREAQIVRRAQEVAARLVAQQAAQQDAQRAAAPVPPASAEPETPEGHAATPPVPAEQVAVGSPLTGGDLLEQSWDRRYERQQQALAGSAVSAPAADPAATPSEAAGIAHEGAPNLPSSGVEHLLAILLAAFAVAVAATPQGRRWFLRRA